MGVFLRESRDRFKWNSGFLCLLFIHLVRCLLFCGEKDKVFPRDVIKCTDGLNLYYLPLSRLVSNKTHSVAVFRLFLQVRYATSANFG